MGQDLLEQIHLEFLEGVVYLVNTRGWNQEVIAKRRPT